MRALDRMCSLTRLECVRERVSKWLRHMYGLNKHTHELTNTDMGTQHEREGDWRRVVRENLDALARAH